jgi:hypothetical protein
MNKEMRRSQGTTRREMLAAALIGVAAGSAWWLMGRDASAGPVTRDQYGDQIQTVPRGQLPDFARSGGTKVQEAYRYALEDTEVLEYIPCFCGCNNIGHRNNRDCYIKSMNRDGTVTYTSHAAT